MDPNATLARIRELTATLAAGDPPGVFRRIDAEELADLVSSLDRWISGGGFLPGAWR
jgi:hypothetical protein